MAAQERKPPNNRTYTGKLANRLHALRIKAGLSAKELADKIGVKPITIYKYESGTNQVDADLYPKMARALGVSESEFFPPFVG